jgi:hypothetical protein
MNWKRAWVRQGITGVALLGIVICLIAIRPWMRVGAQASLPAPVSVKHAAGVHVQVYDRATALNWPGATTRTVKLSQSFATANMTHYAASHADQNGDHTLTVVAGLVLVYIDGQFLCGFGIAGGDANPFWANVDEVGFMYVDGNYTDGTESADIASTSDETGCDNPGFPSGSYWKMTTEAGAVWFDGTVVDGTWSVYLIQ